MPTYKSICRVCHGGCGAIVHIEDGKVTKIKGDPDSPISRGWMCPKGIHSPDIANHPDRLKTPLKRMGERGEGRWSEISWDQALTEICAKLSQLRAESGPESVALGQGTGRHHYMRVVRFANQLNTPNWYEPGLAQCFIPRITVSNLTYGGFVTPDYYGDTKPACILFWAHNPLVTSADSELAPAVQRAMTNDCYKIAIDPRRSETGQKCDMWLPIRPGTDAALALAMSRVIIYDDLYDHDFVENWTSGFDDYKKHVADFTPSWAERITGVPAEDIIKAATIYATRKPGVIEWGVGLEQNVNTLQTVRAIAILRALTGNLDVPGGDIIGSYSMNPYPILKDKLPSDISKKRIGGDTYKLLSGFRAYMPSAHIPGLIHAMRDGDPYRIRGLMLFGNNPLTTVADSRAVYDAMMKLDLLVVTDLFMTPSAYLADYVLPAAFWTEFEHLIGVPLVAENFAFAHRKLAQTGDCRQDEWIMDEIARRMNLPGCEVDYREIFNHQLAPTGKTFDQLLDEGGYHCPPVEYYKYKAKGFRTLSRKVEISCAALKRMGYDPLPSYVEPPESPYSQPALAEKYQYILITGARRKVFFHSEHRQVSSLRKLSQNPMVQIHPQAAKVNNIADGDWVIVATPRGEARFMAELTENINPFVISVDHGWWFPERGGESLFGLFESSANVLTNAAPPYDPAFGSYQLRGLLCSIRRSDGQ